MKRKFAVLLTTAIAFGLAGAPIGSAQSSPTPPNSPDRPNMQPKIPTGPIQDPNAQSHSCLFPIGRFSVTTFFGNRKCIACIHLAGKTAFQRP
jgi:hypothetical protein